MQKQIKQLGVILCIVALPLTIQAKEQHRVDRGAKIYAQLDLNQTQHQDIEQQLKQRREDKQVFAAELASIEQQLTNLTQQADLDVAAAQVLIERKHNIQGQLAKKTAISKHAIWQSLNPTQQTQFDKLRHKRPNKKRHHRRSNTWKGLKKLNLNDEQQVQIAQLKAQQKTFRKNTKLLKRTQRQAMQDIIRAETFDPDAWQTEFDASKQQRTQHATDNLLISHQLWNILNGGQQEKWLAIQQKRQKRRAGIGK